jgi:hypothetical protein
MDLSSTVNSGIGSVIKVSIDGGIVESMTTRCAFGTKDGREDTGRKSGGPFEEAPGANCSNSICAIAAVREGYGGNVGRQQLKGDLQAGICARFQQMRLDLRPQDR